MLSVCADNDQLYYAHKDPEQVVIGINKDGKQNLVGTVTTIFWETSVNIRSWLYPKALHS